MFKARFLIIFLAAAVLLAACLSPAGGLSPAGNAPGGGSALQITEAWARPALSGGNSAVYFVIHNEDAWTDSLQSASSEVASAVELHMTSMEGDHMQMHPQREVSIPPGETGFEPGGLHVMLIGLKQELKPGDTFSISLQFARAGERAFMVAVKEP